MHAVKRLSLWVAVCTSIFSGTVAAEPFVLRVGSDYYEPFNYLDAEGDFAGVDVELAREACRRMGCVPVFVTIDWARKDEYLAQGDVDCLWGSFTMTGREGDYRWAGPYMASHQAVLVWADSPVKHLSDLAGKTVAVQTTTKPEGIFLKGGDDRVPAVASVYSLPGIAGVIATLRKGYVDAVAGHENALLQYVPEDQEKNYRILPEYLMEAHLGVAFSKDDARGIDRRLTDVLQAMRRDGTVAAVVKKYGLKTW